MQIKPILKVLGTVLFVASVATLTTAGVRYAVKRRAAAKTAKMKILATFRKLGIDTKTAKEDETPLCDMSLRALQGRLLALVMVGTGTLPAPKVKLAEASEEEAFEDEYPEVKTRLEAKVDELTTSFGAAINSLGNEIEAGVKSGVEKGITASLRTKTSKAIPATA